MTLATLDHLWWATTHHRVSLNSCQSWLGVKSGKRAHTFVAVLCSTEKNPIQFVIKPSLPQRKQISLAAVFFLDLFRGFIRQLKQSLFDFVTTKRKIGFGIQFNPKTDWKWLLLEVGKIDERDLWAEIWPIQLPCEVIKLLNNQQRPDKIRPFDCLQQLIDLKYIWETFV